MIAANLVRRGYKVAIPYGEDWDFDLIVCRDEKLERVQCKYTRSDGKVVIVRCSSHSLTNGRVRATKRYTGSMVDWIAVYDATTDRCYYIPAAQLGDGMMTMTLRLAPTRNNQVSGIRRAEDYVTI
jgi:PD-(D/E)XK endonuclease